MVDHRATIRWAADTGDFRKLRYSRVHSWSFDGGITVPASSSPHVVRPPFSDPAAIDPEEALVAAISSCHMLTFLYVAAKAGFEVESYVDEAVGVLSKNEHGVPWVSETTLHPVHRFRGEKLPTDAEIERLHEEAHHECFIAQSVKTRIVVDWSRAG